MLHDQEKRLQMIKLKDTPKNKTDEAARNPSASDMTRRWDIRQDVVQQKQVLEDTLGPLPTMVDIGSMNPDIGLFPKKACIQNADGEFEENLAYVPFDPPSMLKMGGSSMADNWKRYARAGHLDKVAYQQKEMMGKSVAITVQKRYPKADLTKWPLNEDGPTTHSDFRQIWEVGGETHGASHTARKNSDKGKKPAQTKKGKTNANARQSRQSRQSTDDQTKFLNDLRTTVAGPTVEKLLVEKLVQDNAHLTNANRILASNAPGIQWQPLTGAWNEFDSV
ncbi:hypothetical protein Neosp_007823 [[Neocosmospora] mangrovei]